MPIEDRVRESVESFMKQVEEALEAFTARARCDLDAHLRSLTADLLRFARETQDACRTEVDRAVEDTRAETERAFRARMDALRTELARELEHRVASERADLQAVRAEHKPPIREARVDTLDRLLAAVRRIDEATTLTAILETLARGVAAEMLRVAVLIAEGDRVRVWAHFGFTGTAMPDDVQLGQAGPLAAAISLQQTSFVSPAGDRRPDTLPAFMHVPAGHTGLVTPILVTGEAVAVLYADDVDRPLAEEDGSGWTGAIELLVRHAAVRLENVTTERTVELVARPA
jgi:hypothetical protein